MTRSLASTSRLNDALALQQKYIDSLELQRLGTEKMQLDKRMEALKEAKEDLDVQRRRQLSELTESIPGLVVGEDKLYMNNGQFDIPLSQLSESEKIVFAMKVASMTHPTLPICSISDGGLLGNKMFAEVKSLAEKHKVFLWIEDTWEGRSTVVMKYGKSYTPSGEPTFNDAAEVLQARPKIKVGRS